MNSGKPLNLEIQVTQSALPTEFEVFRLFHCYSFFSYLIIIESAIKFINIVGSSISAVDCSSAPDCTALNRKPCVSTANTCGMCLDGYIGKVGDFNVKCQSGTAKSKAVGVKCASNDECLYNLCSSGVCAAPPKECPSAIAGSVCSGNGNCQYTDVANNPTKTCSELDVNCNAFCVCKGGFGGVDCSLTRYMSQCE